MAFGSDHISPKENGTKITHKDLPVLTGFNYEHVMAKATITQYAEVKSPTTNQVLEPARLEITITASGGSAIQLGEFVSANEIVALSFGGVPVRPVPQKEI